MRSVALFLVLGFALMYRPAKDLAETPEEAAPKATYLVVYRRPGVVDRKVGNGSATERARKVHAEPLHQRLNEASGPFLRTMQVEPSYWKLLTKQRRRR